MNTAHRVPANILEVTGIVNPDCVFPSAISVTVLGKPERQLDRCLQHTEQKRTGGRPERAPVTSPLEQDGEEQSWDGVQCCTKQASVASIIRGAKRKGNSPRQSRLWRPDVCKQGHNAVPCCTSFLLCPLQVTKPPKSKRWIKLNILQMKAAVAGS